MKWILLIAAAIIGYMIYTGNLGGAREATQNYTDVMNQGKEGYKKDGKPAIMHQYIEQKEKGSIK